MSSEWSSTTIEELAADERSSISIGPFGSRMKSDCYVDSGVPVIRGNNISGGKYPEGDFVFITEAKASKLKSSQVSGGDLVFPHRGAIGRVALIPENGRMILSSSLMKVTPSKEHCYPAFLLYFFRSRKGIQELLKNASTVGTPGIGQPLTSLKQVQLDLPPLEEQKAIAHILGTFDDKIELNRRSNETLEGIAKALFRSWFVDFNPVRAKAEGRPTGLPDEISELFPDSFENSELGEIPSSWKVSNIAGIANVEMGQSPSGESCSMDPVGLPLLNGPTEFGGFCPTPVQYTSDPKRYCQSGDLLFCVRGSTTGRMNWSDQSYAIGRGLAAITCSGMDHILMARILIEDSLPNLLAKATGSTFPSVSRKDIESISVFIPTPSVRHLYKEICSSAYQRMALCFKEVSTLIQIRDVLLPRLISGELRVPDAERMLEEVGI